MRPCWPCSAHTLSLYMRIPSKGVRNVGQMVLPTQVTRFLYPPVVAGLN